MVKVKFVARLGKMGEEKIHVLVPKGTLGYSETFSKKAGTGDYLR
jgi:hypothetical protein